jgi:hypothetical protein
MNYNKPEITAVASASAAIQGNPPTKSAGSKDNTLGEGYVSIPAYEADE